MNVKRCCALALAAVLSLFAVFPATALPKDTTPHSAVELRLIGAITELSPEATEAGMKPEDFGELGVETVIRVRETFGCREVYDETGGGAYTARWVLVPADPTRETAEALADALTGKTGRHMLGDGHPLADALFEARVIDYEGTDIYAYGNLLAKVWVPVDKSDALISAGTPDFAFYRATFIAVRGDLAVFVLWPADPADFDAVKAGLDALYAGGYIYDGVAAPTFEVKPLLEAASLGAMKPLAGDPDGDGLITAADAREALRAAVGLPTATPYPLTCDADGDGDVTSADARLILRAAVGLEREAMRVRVPVLTSGRTLVGAVEEHTDGGYRLTAESDSEDLGVEQIELDLALPGTVGESRFFLFMFSTKTPGAYRVTLTEKREWEDEPLSVREILVSAR